jgi:hypothetical protein
MPWYEWLSLYAGLAACAWLLSMVSPVGAADSPRRAPAVLQPVTAPFHRAAGTPGRDAARSQGTRPPPQTGATRPPHGCRPPGHKALTGRRMR